MKLVVPSHSFCNITLKNRPISTYAPVKLFSSKAKHYPHVDIWNNKELFQQFAGYEAANRGSLVLLKGVIVIDIGLKMHDYKEQ